MGGKNGVSFETVELADDEAFTMNMLAQGDIDALVSMDSFGAQEKVVPVCKIGSSDYYFAVNRARPDLLAELNGALMAIQDEDPYTVSTCLKRTSNRQRPTRSSPRIWRPGWRTTERSAWDTWRTICRYVPPTERRASSPAP